MRLSAAEIADAVGGIIIAGSADNIAADISTDSKTAKDGDIFVPIVGARVDAHKFISAAAANKAAAAFTAYGTDRLAELAGISESELAERLCISVDTDADGAADTGEGKSGEAAAHANALTLIKVDDTRAALQRLGAYYRRKYVHIPYIGVTGSVGKTTVREMTACALSASYKVYSTKGNANSQTGVPITVTRTDADADVGVIEMGMSEFGEMHRISEVVQCDAAVFTVIGVSHIGNLGSRENIMREKLHILDGMHEGGVLILNGDDDMLSRDDIRDFFPAEAAGRDIRIIYYGTHDNADVRARNISDENGCFAYDLVINGENAARVALSVPGEHMLLNSLAALAAAYCSNADIAKAAENIGHFSSLDGRGRIYESKGVTIINDAYNAAPQSVKAGLKVLDGLDKAERRIAVLADMLELGPDELEYHREVGRYIAGETKNIDIVMLYGELSKAVAEGIKLGFCDDPSSHMPWVYCFDDINELKKTIGQEIYEGDAVLFKGSNSMKLGQLVSELYPSSGE